MKVVLCHSEDWKHYSRRTILMASIAVTGDIVQMAEGA